MAFCYGWWRPSTQRYLYIGQTTLGYKRLTQHNIIGRGVDFEPLDEIHFWYPLTQDANPILQAHHEAIEVAAMEKELIALHQPELNCNEMGVHRVQRNCEYCTQPFYANRGWMKFCSKKCREKHWQGKPASEKAILKICVHCKAQYDLLVKDIEHERSHFCPTCRGTPA